MPDARTTLNVAPRENFGSRNARRMRREGLVPGVVYAGGSEATPFQVSEREVRNVLAEGAALFDISVDGGKARPVVIKEQQLHPVRGTLRHIDLQEVNLKEAIQADVTIELEGVDDAPGIKAGGVLDQVTREITVEALPTDIPDSITVDVSTMEINDTLQLSAIEAPSGVTFMVEEDEEVTIAVLAPPRVEEAAPEVEEETELIGETGEGDSGEGGGTGGGSEADTEGE
jgi:large subunit ribosomal protein L25